MNRLTPLFNILGHYKYVITIVAGIVIVGFLDENSFMKRVQLELQISDMKSKIEEYNIQNESDMKQLNELKRNPHAYEKIARERYFMKADDEDIFVLSDDEKSQNNDNETTE